MARSRNHDNAMLKTQPLSHVNPEKTAWLSRRDNRDFLLTLVCPECGRCVLGVLLRVATLAKGKPSGR